MIHLCKLKNISIGNPSSVEQHHEDTKVHWERFNDGINKLTDSFIENPFIFQTMSPINNKGITYDNEKCENIKNIQEMKKLNLANSFIKV